MLPNLPIVDLTLALSKRNVEFHKGEARKHHTQYQRMIRRLLDAYPGHHSKSQTPTLDPEAHKTSAHQLAPRSR